MLPLESLEKVGAFAPTGSKNKLSLDLHPLSVTEGRGFREYAQELINVGAEFGTQSFLDLVVSRKCLSTRVMIEEYDKLKKQIMADVADQNVAFTTDMWTDEHTQRSFISLSAHYINNKFELKVSLLGEPEMPEPGTAAQCPCRDAARFPTTLCR
ncbi:hypothetical protein ACLKA7_012633 [Drosophila subpalustris]